MFVTSVVEANVPGLDHGEPESVEGMVLFLTLLVGDSTPSLLGLPLEQFHFLLFSPPPVLGSLLFHVSRKICHL